MTRPEPTSLYVGAEVTVKPGSPEKPWRADWQETSVWVAGLRWDGKDELNVTISTNWPPENLGDLTDDFRPSDLVPVVRGRPQLVEPEPA